MAVTKADCQTTKFNSQPNFRLYGIYTEIKSAGSVSEKVTVEKQLKSDISELKIVYAARIED